MVVIKFSVLLRKYNYDIIKSTILYPDPTGKKERISKSLRVDIIIKFIDMKIENILNDEELANLVGGSFSAVSTQVQSFEMGDASCCNSTGTDPQHF